MSTASILLNRAGLTAFVSVLVAFSSSSVAAPGPLVLTDKPLFLTSGVKPNVIMAVDDSSSMDGELLLANNDGAAWWRTADGGGCPRGYVGCGSTGTADIPSAGRTNFNFAGEANGTWKKYVYLFPIGTGTGLRVLGDSTNDHFAIAPLPDFAWTRAPEFNSSYFNPAETYIPWQSTDTTTFANATPSAALTDPTRGANIFDLTKNRMSSTSVPDTQTCSGTTPTLNTNHQFRMYPGMSIPKGTCYRVSGSGDWTVAAKDLTITDGKEDLATLKTEASGDGIGIAIRYYPATFYLKSDTALPASFGWKTTATTLSGTGPNGETLKGYEIKAANFSTTAQYTEAMQNFANWWTYYRKRHAATRAGIGSAFSDIKNTRVGSFTIGNLQQVTMRDIDNAADRNTFLETVYDYVGSGGTPNREAVSYLGTQFNRANGPITEVCQKNFGILFTDGFSNASTPNPTVGNADGAMGSPFQDSVSNTTADYATYFYNTRLRTDLAAGQVPIPPGCTADSKTLDCNKNLHMNFFAVTLGTQGLIYGVDTAKTNDPFANPPTWPTSFRDRHPSAVDDLWHATLNTRGDMLNAKTPKDIGVQLSNVLTTISDRSASAAAAAVNSGSISSDTRIFQAAFDSTGWTGELMVFPLTDTGVLGTPEWYASKKLPAAAGRKIITANSNGTAVAFQWANLDATRQGQLDSNQLLLNYLRGDPANEGDTAPKFRQRLDGTSSNRLGDIVSSAPLYVGLPPFRYRDSLESKPYSAFVKAQTDKKRPPMVYVGANDGMVHGFNADSKDAANRGMEKIAFIPSPVFARLKNLAKQNYSHEFYVDGSPSTGDAFFNNDWHTVVVGGLNKGGKGIYALDVTDPASFTDAENDGVPPKIMLWEFTEADDPQPQDLGLTYSQPTVVKLQNGTWAVVFGNGYNSTSGKAVLYIVDLATGNLIKKFDTGVTAPTTGAWVNGLSTPSLVDIDGDRKVDYAYAGDLYGNMWKFDLSGATTDTWKIAYGSAGGWLPLFTATDGTNPQPITVRPEVARGPNGAGLVVLFGTGKFLEETDKSLTPVRNQSFYGIIDRNTGVAATDRVTRGNLLAQTILAEVSVDPPDPDGSGPLADPPAINVRATSNNVVGDKPGWYINLVSPSGYQAEKQVSNPVVRNGNVIFTTLIPDANPCKPGGTSWVMEMNVLSGSRLDVPPFDLNNDGQFTSADNLIPITVGGVTIYVSASGVGSTEGILQSPGVADGVFKAPGDTGPGTPVQYKFLPGSSGVIQRVTENPGLGGVGRQSWRQIR